MSDTDPALSRLEQQETWRKRLTAAEAAYQRASEELRLALLNRNGAVENAPEVVAARARKASTRAEYLRILRVFTDLVLRGKSPSSNEK